MPLLDSMPHTATAKRRTRTRDALMGRVDTWPDTLFAGRACWNQQASASEVMQWQARGVSVSHKVFFASNPGVDSSCCLEVGGRRLEVRSWPEPDASAGLGVVWRVMCEDIGAA